MFNKYNVEEKKKKRDSEFRRSVSNFSLKASVGHKEGMRPAEAANQNGSDRQSAGSCLNY